jgi:hypothetical protein
LSYSEDFEDEKSIPLTQSAAYQKMLSAVDVSDEEDDLEEDFLGGEEMIFTRNYLYRTSRKSI